MAGCKLVVLYLCGSFVRVSGAQIMASQKNILNFFKPLPVKRPLSNTSENEGNTSDKKAKVDTINDKKDTTPSDKSDISRQSPFFPNYIQAKIKLVAKRHPALHPNIGESWYEALSPEFGKPYFSKVTHFVPRSQ
jgi:hypothetical protein